MNFKGIFPEEKGTKGISGVRQKDPVLRGVYGNSLQGYEVGTKDTWKVKVRWFEKEGEEAVGEGEEEEEWMDR